MVGSYPRPQWFKHQLLGRDVRVASRKCSTRRRTTTPSRPSFAIRKKPASTSSPTATCGTTTYVGVIGSFCWYMYERIGGFEHAREQHPPARWA